MGHCLPTTDCLFLVEELQNEDGLDNHYAVSVVLSVNSVLPNRHFFLGLLLLLLLFGNLYTQQWGSNAQP